MTSNLQFSVSVGGLGRLFSGKYSGSFSGGFSGSFSGRDFGRFILAALVLSGVSGLAIADSKTTDCQCRAPGGVMKELGDTACFDIADTQKLMRCEMSQNTPYWNEVEEANGCPSA